MSTNPLSLNSLSLNSLSLNRLSRALQGVLLAGACGTVGAAGAADFAGRGVYPFASASGCPLVALTGNAELCNRIALDDADTSASVDPAGQLIHFNNTRSYRKKTVVGDLLLQGAGLDQSGVRVPLSFHLVLSKSGAKWSLSSHTHATRKGNFSAVKIDPYQLDVTDTDGNRVVLLPEQISATVSEPGLVARLASDLVQVRDNRAPGARDADITISIGAAGLSKDVMRARLHSEPLTEGKADALLAQGSWSFELEALTGHIPDRVAQRELFLFGLSGEPLLKPLAERGFKKHEKLTVGALNGQGYLRYGKLQQPFPGAATSARAFLQQSFIGLLLGSQQMDAQDAQKMDGHAH